MDAVEIATIVSAFFGGAAVMIPIYQIISRRRERRPRLTIEASPCFLPTLMPDPGHGFYCFQVTNPGERAVELNNIQIGVKGDQKIVYPKMDGQHPLPHKMEPLDSATFWIELAPLQNRLAALGYEDEAHVTARAHDSLGNVYESPARISLGWGR